MGAYIETPEPQQRAVQLVEMYGAVPIPEPEGFEDIPADRALICVVENMHFDAAAVAYDADTFRAFKYDGTSRPRTWLTMDKALVRTLVPWMYQQYLV